ncbi:MAG: DUF255 domain-containing protein [Bacteroidia bacterium]|nr:DUF255 domain-containing protein [Bacteroidia bacterium]
MNYILFIIFPFLLSFTSSSSDNPTPANDKINWYTWEEAVEANKTEKRKFVIDMYTDWCGWCKVMDKKTFTNSDIVEYVNENFYPIKFDAEQRESIDFNNHTFKYVDGGRNGIHELAYSLLNGRLSYPTIVYLDEEYKRIMISPGYKQPKQLMKELRYAQEEAYKTTKFEEFQ